MACRARERRKSGCCYCCKIPYNLFPKHVLPVTLPVQDRSSGECDS